MTAKAVSAELVTHVVFTDVSVAEDVDGFARFSGDKLQFVAESGEPAIPSQVIRLLLPATADLATVSVTLNRVELERLPGQWDVAPTPPAAVWGGGEVVLEFPAGKRIVDGRDIDIYGVAAPFPTDPLGKANTGRLREWQLVEVGVFLFQYDPVAMTLFQLTAGEIVVEYDTMLTAFSTAIERGTDAEPAGGVGRQRIEDLTINFDEVSPTYDRTPRTLGVPRMMEAEPVPLGPSRSYIILTTTQIASASTQIDGFVASKRQRGFDVEIVTEDAWGGGSGDAAAENIRAWLQANYVSLGIEYVLLIGNPDPATGDVPMKMLWPRSFDSRYREAPSDYYYADLTGNWDLDGDGLYGEASGDFGPGGIDRYYEVIVGRIPYYADREGIDTLDRVLAKIIAYENAPAGEVLSRKKVLLPMEPLDGATPGYHLGEEIKNAIIIPKGDWDFHRVYEQSYGLNPPAETIPTTEDNVFDAWSSDAFGAVVWWTHGWYCGASDVIDCATVDLLDDSHPVFTFQVSCMNSYPEISGNLSNSLLKNGGVATIGATRVSWGWVGETWFAGSNSAPGMGYEYLRRLVSDEMEGGRALLDTKEALYVGAGSTMWMNFTVFNLYGDPAVGLYTTALDVDATVHAPGDVNGDGIADVAVIGSMGHVRIKGLNGNEVSEFWFTDVKRVDDVEVLPDMNGNGAPELAALGTGSTLAEVRDSLTGEQLNKVWFNPGLTPVDLEVVADHSANGKPELALLAEQSMKVVVKDAAMSKLIKNIAFSSHFVAKGLEVYPDLDRNGADDMAVLGDNKNPGKSDKIEVRDLRSGAKLKDIWLGGGWQALALEVIADNNRNGFEEHAVLRKKNTGPQVTVMIRDGKTGRTLRTLRFDKNYPPTHLMTVDDVNRNGSDELIVFGQRFDGSNQKAQIKDSKTGATLRQVWFSKWFPAEDVTVSADINGNGAEELVLLGRHKNNGNLKAFVKDSKTGAQLGTVSF